MHYPVMLTWMSEDDVELVLYVFATKNFDNSSRLFKLKNSVINFA